MRVEYRQSQGGMCVVCVGMPGILQKRRRARSFMEADAARKFQGKWEGTIQGRSRFCLLLGTSVKASQGCEIAS